MQQLEYGVTISAAAIEGHGLLDLRIELQFIRCADIHNPIVAVNGVFALTDELIALGQNEQRAGAFFFFLDVFECFFEHANGRLYVAIFQMKIRVHLVDISPDCWIVHAINLGRFDEGVVGPHPIIHGHVRSRHPCIRPSLCIGIIERTNEVLKNFKGFLLLAFDQMRPGNDVIIVINPFVQLRTLHVFLLASGRRHGVLVHHIRAFLNGALHQRIYLLSGRLIDRRKNRQDFIPILHVFFK